MANRRIPAEGLFALSAVSQYIGAAIAVSVFDDVAPQTVGWLRVVGAAITLSLIARPRLREWRGRRLAGVAMFGIATAAMNTFFYLAIDRIDLGKSVAIEFIGPILVAAVATRSARNGAALIAAASGVVVLGGLEFGVETTGLIFILASSACWAIYILVGARVAVATDRLDGLAVGLVIGAVVLTPLGAPSSGSVWTTPALLLACLVTGVFSNAIGYGIDQYVLRRVSIRRFSLLLAMLPVTAVVVGWVLLSQRPTGIEFVGIAAVLAGVSIQDREEPAHRVPATG